MRFYVYLCLHFYLTHLIYSFLFLLSQSPAGFSPAPADTGLGTSEKQGSETVPAGNGKSQRPALCYIHSTYTIECQTVDKKGLKFQGNVLGSWVTAGPQACPSSLGQWFRMWLGKSCCLSLNPSLIITLGPTASQGPGQMRVTITRNNRGLVKIEVCFAST